MRKLTDLPKEVESADHYTGCNKDTSLSTVIARVSVVLKRTVGDSDLRFDNLSGSPLQSQSNIISSVDGIYVSGY